MRTGKTRFLAIPPPFTDAMDIHAHTLIHIHIHTHEQVEREILAIPPPLTDAVDFAAPTHLTQVIYFPCFGRLF